MSEQAVQTGKFKLHREPQFNLLAVLRGHQSETVADMLTGGMNIEIDPIKGMPMGDATTMLPKPPVQ